MKNFVIVLVALVFGFVFDGFAQKTYKGLTGEELYKKDASKYRKIAAKMGYAPAQLDVGERYHIGYGIFYLKNQRTALYWIKKSAENGYAKAQYELGNIYYIYYKEYNIKPNDGEAEKWYSKAANQNYSGSYNMLGSLYKRHERYDLAEKWFKHNIEYGNSQCSKFYSMTDLAEIYEEGGNGIKQNKEYAYKYYEMANVNSNTCSKRYAEEGVKRLKPYVDELRKNRMDNALERDAKLLANSTDAQKIYNLASRYDNAGYYKQAFEWYKKAANLGHTDAQNSTGTYYYRGTGTDINYKNAVYWFQKAADKKDKYALYNLGLCYENGNGVTKNINTAMQYYKQSADAGHSNAKSAYQRLQQQLENEKADRYRKIAHEAYSAKQYGKAIENYKTAEKLSNSSDDQYYIGKCYFQTGDMKQALSYFIKSADRGNSYAKKELSDIYYRTGKTALKDEDYYEAITSFKTAYNYGNAEAAHQIGLLYYNGNGVAKDEYTALSWFEKAKNGGSALGADSYNTVKKNINARVAAERQAAENERQARENERQALELQRQANENQRQATLATMRLQQEMQNTRETTMSNNNNNNSYNNNSSNNRQKQQVVCTKCNGTGFEVDKSGMNGYKCQHTSTFGNCNYTTCTVCKQRHCYHFTKHKTCFYCKGTGYVEK